MIVGGLHERLHAVAPLGAHGNTTGPAARLGEAARGGTTAPISRRAAMMARESFDTAFRRLFGEQFPSLFRYLDRLCGDPASAADHAQEAFTRLYERGEMPSDPRAWLVTVGTNLLRDERRTSLRRRRLLAGQAPERVVGDPPTAPDERVLLDERRRAVRSALEALSDRERRALLLRYEGFSYREIALALGVAESGVGTLVVRAKASFLSAFGRSDAASE